MIGNKRLLAIIPARGGSKRLPRKNILDLSGKPLIAWTIEAALSSKYVDRAIVSTDDNQIAEISKQFGGDVPFKRPVFLSTDNATSIDVVIHALKKLEYHGDHYDYVILLQPTSPLRSANDIDRAVEILVKKQGRAIISVCKAEHHPLWCNKLTNELAMSDFMRDEIKNMRSQDLPDYFRLNGSIYLCEVESLTQQKTFLIDKDVYAYIMPQERSIDIDEEIDLLIARVMHSSL